MLKTGQLFPDFTLTRIDGLVMKISDFRNQQNLVVILLSALDPLPVIQEMSANQDSFTSLNAAVLLVRANWSEDAMSKVKQSTQVIHLLAGSPGTALLDQRIDGSDNTGAPITYILDRYGEIYATYPSDGQDGYPGVQPILEWLQYLEIRCSA